MVGLGIVLGMDGFGKGSGFALGRLLMLVSGLNLVMRVYFVALILLFHTSNYCIAFLTTLFLVSFAYFGCSLTNTIFQMRLSFTSICISVY